MLRKAIFFGKRHKFKILFQMTSLNQIATQCFIWHYFNYYIMQINKNYIPNN